MRLAAPFEAVRARTIRHAARIGRTPVVHLLTRGDVRMRIARANFCLNLFGCAGLAITQGPDLAPDADLVVLCSADDAYVVLANEIVPVGASSEACALRQPLTAPSSLPWPHSDLAASMICVSTSPKVRTVSAASACLAMTRWCGSALIA